MDKEQFILLNYITMKIADIAKELEMSEANVKRVARNLGIRKFRSAKWTDEETKFLKEHYPLRTAEWCALQIGRSKTSVQKKVEQLKVKPNYSYIHYDKQGYVVDTSNRSKKQYVHRKVMEEMIGRPLRSNEIVHHIDGDKQNNHPSNLQIVTRAEHINIHRDDLNRGK